jgi:hypothetical protein
VALEQLVAAVSWLLAFEADAASWEQASEMVAAVELVPVVAEAYAAAAEAEVEADAAEAGAVVVLVLVQLY